MFARPEPLSRFLLLCLLLQPPPPLLQAPVCTSLSFRCLLLEAVLSSLTMSARGLEAVCGQGLTVGGAKYQR